MKRLEAWVQGVELEKFDTSPYPDFSFNEMLEDRKLMAREIGKLLAVAKAAKRTAQLGCLDATLVGKDLRKALEDLEKEGNNK